MKATSWLNRHRGEVEVYLHIISTLVLEGVGDQQQSPAALPPEKSSAHCTGHWVGLTAGLDRHGKSRLPTEFDSRNV